jgi:uncharacterized membrane protein YqiK
VSEPVISIHKDNSDQDEEFETLDDGQVVACKWVSLKDAADESGQPLRTIRDWATDRSNRKAIVQSKRESDAFNAKILVWLPDVMRQAAGKPAKEKDILPIPAAAFEQLTQLWKQNAELQAERAKAEAKAEFQTEKVVELKKERDELRAQVEALVAPAQQPDDEISDETVDIREDVTKETPKRRFFGLLPASKSV